jgi:hypothetical protein
VVHAWVNHLLVERMSLEPGALTANDTSMRSRVTAYLSDAMLAFEQGKYAFSALCQHATVEILPNK